MKHLLNKEIVTRQELAEAVADQLKDYNHFLLDMVMRTGKSAVASAIASRLTGNILILSAAESTNKQWVQNLEKYAPDVLQRVDIYCYHSLHKLDREKYSIIMLDEFELALSDIRLGQIQEFNPKHWIAMSGTLSKDDVMSFRSLTKNQFYHAKVDLKQAVKWGIIPAPSVICVPLQLDDKNPYLIYKKSANKKKENKIVDFRDRFSYSMRDYNVHIKCTETQYSELIDADLKRLREMYEDDPAEFRKLAMLRKGKERKDFYARIKTKHLKRLLEKLPADSRKLIFCNDTTQANIINEDLSIHSKSPNNLDLIEKFNNKEIDTLVSVKMLDRGVDFESVDYAIIIQQSGKQNSPQQQAGRTYLSDLPKVITFYYPGTKDETYLNNFLKQFNPEWIKYKQLQ